MNGAQGRTGGPDIVDDIIVYGQGILLILITLIGLVALVALVGQAVLFIALPDCQTEDSTNCYWDGGSNGTGDKYFVLGDIVIITESAE